MKRSIITVVGLATCVAVSATVGLGSANSEPAGPSVNPLSGQLSVLRPDGGKMATAAEVASVTASVPTQRAPFSPVPSKYEFGSANDSRVLLDDPNWGRTIVVPAVNGNGLCFSVTMPSSAEMGGMTSCDGGFNKIGIMPAMGTLKGSELFLKGIADDSVDSISVVSANGERSEVALNGNVFNWAAPSGSFEPTQISTISDGVESHMDVRFPRGQ